VRAGGHVQQYGDVGGLRRHRKSLARLGDMPIQQQAMCHAYLLISSRIASMPKCGWNRPIAAQAPAILV
jgi:hypothetical protein